MSGHPSRIDRYGKMTPLLFGGPAVMGLTLFLVLPFLMAVALSFTDQRLVSPEPGHLVMLRNYERLLSVSALVQSPEMDRAGHVLRDVSGAPVYVRVREITRTNPAYRGYRPLCDVHLGTHRFTILAKDPAFLRALGNTFAFAFVVVPLQVTIALGLALLVNAGLWGQTVFRAVYFSPVVMSMVVVSVVWAFLFDKDLGLFNMALGKLSFGFVRPVDWLANPSTAMAAIVILSAWQGAGFQMLILLAGLQGISQELYDAARIDGASTWQRFWHITLPGLRQSIVFVLIVTTVAALGLFTQVDVMTAGGPREATATVMFEAVRHGVREGNIAYGSTICVVYFVLVTALVLPLQWLQRRNVRMMP